MPAHPHDRNRACGWLLNSRAHFPLQEMLAFLYAPQIRYERSRLLGEAFDDRSNITAENSVNAISPSHDCDGQRRITVTHASGASEIAALPIE